ncbi:MAG: hypothetical protein JXM73_06400 [Anaerolineae bacterium]|nr:hypothetical protein [Anaerolineae bacterium]
MTQFEESGSRPRNEEERADEEKIIPWAEGNGLWNRISQLISDLPAVDLVTFLVQNPYTCDTAANLAVNIGRKVAQIEPVLEALAEEGFLNVTVMDRLRVYDLTDDPRHRQTLQQYVTWLREGYHWARMALNQP